MLSRSIAVLLILLAACTPVQTGPSTEAAPYQRWWKNVAQCTGDKRSLNEAVAEIVVMDLPYFDNADHRDGAVYHADTREIWLAKPYARDSVVVQHEMLHAVLEARHISGHPPQYFGPYSVCGVPVTIAGR